jgi:hypothetical protein
MGTDGDASWVVAMIASLAVACPAALLAAMVNKYVVFAISPVTVAMLVDAVTLLQLADDAGRYWIVYDVMGARLLAGATH